VDKYHIDILAANFVIHPDWFDVVVASNLFGDILSDLGPACTGTIGIAPSANINPERTFPSLFEPAVLMTCRKDGTPVASSVSSHCRGPTIVDRATEIRIATSCSPPARRPDPIFWGRCRRVRRMTAHRRV